MTYTGALKAQQHITLYRSIANYGDSVPGLQKECLTGGHTPQSGNSWLTLDFGLWGKQQWKQCMVNTTIR